MDRMQKLMGGKRPRQAIAHFLTQAEWDAPELLRQTALDRLRELGLKRGETVYLMAQMLRDENALEVLDRIHAELPELRRAV